MNRSLFVVLALLTGLFSCKKDPVVVPAGQVRALVTVNHHGTPIPYATVFRKNGTLVFPGQDTTLYEQRYVTDANGQLTIDNLGNGYLSMVLYAKGFDPSWDTTQVTPVWGYQFISVSTGTGENKDIVVSIPVSE